jgi:hypothetical protein
MKYIEINKDTLAFISGPWEADTLPTYPEDFPNLPKEVVNMPDSQFLPGQVWDEGSSSVIDTQASLDFKSRLYLQATDWYVVRSLEGGKSVPTDITTKRTEARASIVGADSNPSLYYMT